MKTKVSKNKWIRQPPQNVGDNLWDRQLHEGRKPYAAFCIYRDLGPGRSMGAVAKSLGRSYALILRWKNIWDWNNRADAFDSTIIDKVRDSLAEIREKLLYRQTRIAYKMQFKIIKRLEKINIKEINPNTLGRWFDTLDKVLNGSGQNGNGKTPSNIITENNTTNYIVLQEILNDPDSFKAAKRLAGIMEINASRIRGEIVEGEVAEGQAPRFLIPEDSGSKRGKNK